MRRSTLTGSLPTRAYSPRRSAGRATAWLAAAAFAASGCGEDRPPGPVPRDGGPPPACGVEPAGIVCVGSVAHECDGDGGESSVVDCASTGEVCAPRLGCRTCVPRDVRCIGETMETCDAEGTAWVTGPTCDAASGQRCSPLGCRDLCADATMARSYIGCEYWPVTARNSQLSTDFDFAVVVANPGLVPAIVTVTRGGAEVATREVAPGALETIVLPWVEALRAPSGPLASALVRDGAYRLVSDVPVTVYQHDPLEYRVDHDCADEPMETRDDGECFSFTNDASLLLPTPALTGSYFAMSRPTQLVRIEGMPAATPGFVAVVAVAAGTTTVTVTTPAFVSASDDGAVDEMTPGDTASFDLAQGDVLSLASSLPASLDCPAGFVRDALADVEYCNLGPQYDLTGATIRATAPVAVVSGHDCTFVPFDRWACDHLEEALFPVEAWGREAVLAATFSLRGEPNLVRVLSSADGNAIRFEPAGIAPDATLDRGEHLEIETASSVRVLGTEPFLAAQFLVGQDYFGIGSSGFRPNGDPSMALGIPVEQFRTSYVFLAPETYAESFVSIVGPENARIVLDGVLLPAGAPIGATGMAASQNRIRGGVHEIEGSSAFGIMVYGYGSYTSYLHPGGLDLRVLNPPI